MKRGDHEIATLIADLETADKPTLRKAVDQLIPLAIDDVLVATTLSELLDDPACKNRWPIAYVLASLPSPTQSSVQILMETLDHRDPDIRWRREEHDLASLAAAQLVMLQHAADIVSHGGRLVYATCSSEPEENEAVAAAFLATTPAFRPVDLREERHASVPRDVIDAAGYLRTYPHVHGLEAFFGAAFVRQA